MTRAEIEALVIDVLDVCAKHRVELRCVEGDGIAIVTDAEGDGGADRLEGEFSMSMDLSGTGAGGAVVRVFDADHKTEERFMVRRRP